MTEDRSNSLINKSNNTEEVGTSSDTVLKNRKAKINEASLKKFDDHLKNFNEKTDHTIYKIDNTTTGTPQLVTNVGAMPSTNPFVLPSTSKNTYGYDYSKSSDDHAR